jgi:iron complex transport system permease protein
VRKTESLKEKHLTKTLWARRLVYCGGALLLLLVMALGVIKGATDIPLPVVRDAFFHFDPGIRQHLAIIDLRLPRVLASALVGAAFSVAGLLMQGITHNPMADSGLMGLNAGAGLILSICFAFFPGTHYLVLIPLSFLGAGLGAVLVFSIASAGRDGATPMRMVLAGSAVSVLLAALSQGISLYFDVAQDLAFWTTGGIARSNWAQFKVLAPWTILMLAAAICLSRQVSLIALGDDVARGLGLNVARTRTLAVLVILALAGAGVAVVGNVGFVGLIIAHLSRYLVGMDYRHDTPACILYGAAFTVGADLVARTVSPPLELPLGVIIGIIGVPFFLYLARRQRR